MSQVEDGDLDVELSMAAILSGKYRDLMKIRAMIRQQVGESKGARFIYGTISKVPLYVVKEPDFRRLKELETLERQAGGEKKNG